MNSIVLADALAAAPRPAPGPGGACAWVIGLAEQTSSPNTQWIALAVALGATFYLMFIRPRVRAKNKRDPLSEPAGQHMSLAQQRAVERDMQNVLVQLAEMARQITAQLDTRAARLETLLEEADGRIKELRGLAAGHQTIKSPATGATDLAGYRSNTIAPSQDAAEDEGEGLAVESLPPPAPEAVADARHREVYELADRGSSVSEIADTTSRPRGEIELILALRRK